MTIAPTTSVAARPHRIRLQAPAPGPGVPNGDGGYTRTWFDLTPAVVSAKIAPATAADLERVTSGTVLSTASSIVTMPYHPQVTTETRILFNGRALSVTGVSNPEERNVETIALCVEMVL